MFVLLHEETQMEFDQVQEDCVHSKGSIKLNRESLDFYLLETF